MKKLFTYILSLSAATMIYAQAPDKLSFQAIVRNASGELMKNSNIGFRIQILMPNEFGAAVFVETQTVTTNENGLATLQIGSGTAVTGKIDSIDWSKGPYFLKTEMDPEGESNYTLTGTQQILSVPYALYAKNADLPPGIVNTASQPNPGDLLYYNGSAWHPVPAGTDGQVLTMAEGIPQWKAPFTGNEIIELHEPVLSTIFSDNITGHNLHLATDGNYYFTSNGGSYSTGKINKYTLNGDFVETYPILIDMRGLMYNKSDGMLYVSGFEANTAERNIYKITDLENGIFEKVLPDAYDYYQSATAISDDGESFYAFNKGTLIQYLLSDGSPVDTFESIQYGNTSGADGVVAVDDKYFYTWDPASGTVYVYYLNGNYFMDLKIPVGNYGYSLSYADGYLFVSIDGFGGTGYWYGYNIRKLINPTHILSSKLMVQPESLTKSQAFSHDDTTIR